MSKNYLKWIQIRSDKAMMMTVCLQSLVNELLNQKSDSNNGQSTIKADTRISFLKRDETNQFRPMTTETTGTPLPSPTALPSPPAPAPPVIPARNSVRQKLKEISTTVFFKNGQNRVHNEAFEGIGDEDL